MPIEVREVVIKAVVDPGKKGAPGGDGKGPPATGGGGGSAGGGDAVQEAVDKVMEILKDKEER